MQLTIECTELVLRAVRRSAWLDEEGNIRLEAFLRDRKADEDGLSVGIASRLELETWILGLLKSSHGANSLHTGRVRDLGLDVVQTEEESASGSEHAVIVGVPTPDEDAAKAEHLATMLAGISRSYDRTRRRKS